MSTNSQAPSGYGGGNPGGAQAGQPTGPMGKGAPTPPNFGAAAAAQGASSQSAVNNQTTANRADQSNPWASSNWVQGPNGQWTQQIGFNGPMGAAMNGLQSQFAANAGQPVMTGDAARDQAIQGAYGQATSRLDPQWNQRQEQLSQQLANQGLTPGSEAYEKAMQDFSQERNDAYSSAMNSAIGQGTQAGQAVFGENMAARELPMQELQGLQGFLQMPGYNAAGQAQPTDWLGAAGMGANYGLQSQEMQNQLWADILGGAGQAGSSLMSGAGSALGSLLPLLLSDERAKTRVHRLPVEAAPGIPLATFKYKHAPEKGHQLGVIAQDVEKVRPDAVVRDEAGLRHVDYAKLKPFGTR